MVLAAVLAARRLAGALAEPLDGSLLVALAIGLVIVLTALRSTWYSVLSTQHFGRRAAIEALPRIAAIVLLAALTLPGTSPMAVALAWFVLASAELATWIPRGRSRPRQAPLARTAVSEEEAAEEEISGALVQSLTRERTADGGESLHALVRAACEPGDQVAVVHLAFCPPLATAPELTAHVLDESGGEARITLAQSYGARVEVRLPRAAVEGQAVLIEVLGSVAAKD